ncbi:MAG TPA: SIR2 family protein [Polyangia bacterium]|nr:SIR2 family protein [Polyangia bacterium]
MIEIPSALIDAIKARKAVLVCGLGLGRQGKQPGWDGLFATLTDWLEDETVKSEVRTLLAAGKRTTALAALATKLTDEVVVEILKDTFPPAPTAKIPETLTALAAIPWRGVVTTAWNTAWDGALAAINGDPATVFLPREAGAALDGHRGRFLLHLFGSTAAPETLALSPGDLRRKLAPTGVGRALASLYGRWSFVFVGFSPGDPDLVLITERLLGGQPTTAEHFLIYPGEAGFVADTLTADLGATALPFAGEWTEAVQALTAAWSAVAEKAQPGDDDIEGWLEAWRRDASDHQPREALARAEARLRAERQWERLLLLLLGRAERMSDPADKIAELREAARLCDVELRDPARAFATLLPAFRLDPDQGAVLAELAAFAGKAHAFAEFVVEYTEVAVGLGRHPSAARHWAEIGRVYAAELDQVDNAIGSYQQVLAVEPAHAGALGALRTLLAKQKRWSELAPVLAAAADAAPDRAEEIALRLQLGQVLASNLRDSDGALAAFERVYQIAPATPQVLDALEGQYRARERWSDVARILEEKARVASDGGEAAEAARIRKQRAELLAERVGDVDASIVTMETVLGGDPDNRMALRQLELLYEKAGRDEDALRTLERLATLAEAPAERVSLLRRLAATWQSRPEGLDRAAAVLEQILTIDSSDEEAFRALGGVYRRSRRWLALVETLRRRLAVVDAPVERQEHQAALGKIYADELGDSERALEAYGAAAEAGDQREATWEALAQLHEQHKHWRLAAQSLDKLATLTKDPAKRSDALYRASVVYGERLDDKAAAEERLAQVLAVDPGFLPALSALSASYRLQGQHLRAATLMMETAERTQNRLEKTRLLYEAGTLFEDKLNDPAQATAAFAQALAVDPEHLLSAERLVELYTGNLDWAALEPVLDMLARKVDAKNAALGADVQGRLGFAAHKLGKLEKAQRCYETAYRLAPDAVAVLAGYAEFCFDTKSWQKAGELLRALVERHLKELPRDQLVDVYARLGKCDSERGDRRSAVTFYQKALAVDPHHRPSMEAMAELHLAAGDWVALLLDKRTLLTMADGEEKIRLSEEIGDLYAEKLHNPGKAIAAYQSVLALAPLRRHALHKILELYTASQQWPRAAETLVRLTNQEELPAVRAKYLYAAAVIQRDEMNDRSQALALLNRALDDAPDLTKALDAIERITTEIGDWKELARNYRRMIKRLPPEGHDQLRLRLWNSLGEVALQRLNDRDLGTTALEVASTLDPDNIKRHERLAELYVQAGPDQIDKAINHHQLLITKNPDRLSTYRTLASLYEEAGQIDKQWCVSATLVFLRKADPEVQQFYEQHRPAEVRATRRKFTDEVWPRIVHPQEDPFVAAIFILLGHFVAATTAQQHQTVGIKRKDRADVARDDRPSARVLRYVAQTLDLPAPDLFFSDAESQALSLLNLQEKGVLTPALVIGQAFAQRSTEHDLVFELGKRLSFLRPERFLRSALPSAAALDITLRAALALAGASIGNGSHNGEVDRLTDHLRRLVPRPVSDQLAVVGRKLLAAHGDVIDTEAWMAGSDMTATRVGFVLANDLNTAARMISAEPPGLSPLPAKERLRDLLAYAVSEDYFAVRKFLGLEVM